MIQALGQQCSNEAEAALRRMHSELELQVGARTASMAAALEELQRQMEERKRLEKELLEMTERERVRLGQELHDNLGQQLTGIALLTRSLGQKLKDKRLRESKDALKIEALVNQAIDQTRELARHLTSAVLARGDLPSALKELSGQVKRTFGLSCRCEIRGKQPLPLVESEARQLYNIAQEAVTNAIKHGQATRLVLRLASRPDRVDLSVINNGVPFNGDSGPSPGMGLRIMHYRSMVIGAWLDIRPRRAGGTEVVCSLPVRQKLLPGIGGGQCGGVER